MEDDIPQKEVSQQNEISNSSDKKTFTLKITPSFGNSSNGRSAYPEFSATQLADYTFHAVCTDSFGEVEGVYDSTSGQVLFTIYCADFTKTVKFIVKDSDGHAIWFAQKENLAFTRGGNIEISTPMNFKPYTAALGNTGTLPKGNINLTVSAPSDSKIVCKIYDSTGAGDTLGESGATGKVITVTGTTNSCSITTTSGIYYGEYIAKFFIYKDGYTYSNPDFRQQKIIVWPGITTNAWYLSDGSKEQDFAITITPGVKFYVIGRDPSGPYSGSGSISLPANYPEGCTKTGSITAPFTYLEEATSHCYSDSTDYRIIVCGKINGGDAEMIIDDATCGNSITVEGAAGPEYDQLIGEYYNSASDSTIAYSSTHPGTTLNIESTCTVNLKNLKITGGYQTSENKGGGIHVRTDTNEINVNIENCEISGNTANHGGGIYVETGHVNLLSGTVIKDNTATDTTYGGGAIWLDDDRRFSMSGSAYIPYGVSGTTGIGKNDVRWRIGRTKIEIAGRLTPPAACTDNTVATICPTSYSASGVVLLLAENVNPTTSIPNEYNRFAVIPKTLDDGSSQPWEVDNEGKLKKWTVALTNYTTEADVTFDGTNSLASSSVFLSGRNLGTIRRLIVSDHETTQGEYKTYCKFGGGTGYVPTLAQGLGEYYPAYYVSWYDAIVYCNLRSMADDLEPVYVVNGSTDPTSTYWGCSETDGKYCAPASCNWEVTIQKDKNGWRLPYEVEWEYLARGGNLNSDGFTYSGSGTASNVAWYNDSTTHIVKQKTKNALDLYDMSGNVWELTNDWHISSLNKKVSFDGPDYNESTVNGTVHQCVIKGGAYGGNLNQIKVSNRYFADINQRYYDVGFRVVRYADEWPYIGNKAPNMSKQVGDLVFNDGSCMAYSEWNALTNATVKNTKKAAAVGIIFYKGTELNSGTATTKRTLGVGFAYTTGLRWCTNDANGKSVNITSIQCIPGGTSPNLTFTDSSANDRNGKDNLEQIKSFLGANDDTETESKYPAFYFAKNYKDQKIGSETSSRIASDSPVASDWYLPSIAELSKLYLNGIASTGAFSLNTVCQNIIGTSYTFPSSGGYRSSTQDDTDDTQAYELLFSSGSCIGDSKSTTSNMNICAIREF